MFTGIVEEIGVIQRIEQNNLSSTMTIKASKVLEDTVIGDSIAVNGTCLTVTGMGSGYFQADIMAETVRRTGFANFKPGTKVNLERALTLNKRLGGHIVSGHIDGCGTVVDMKQEENAVWVTIEAKREILKGIIEKGSIAIDGISLTVAYVDEHIFKVSIIPHTGEETTLLERKPGDLVNLECDMIGKYVEKLLFFGKEEKKTEEKSKIDEDFLKQYGFF